MNSQYTNFDNEYNVIFFIADISGYTKFIVTNEKALIHSQIIIKDIITTIIKEVELPLKVFKLEGDAVFLYADKDNPEYPWEDVKETMLDQKWLLRRTAVQKSQDRPT